MYPQSSVPFAAISQSIPALVTDSGLFAQFILLVLFIISVISWAVMWDRARLFMRLRRKGAAAQKDLQAKGLKAVIASVEKYIPSVEGSVLSETRNFLQNTPSMRGSSPALEGGRIVQSLRNNLERRATEEISEMEKHLVFLATTTSVSPFLGLLGTVWGIMSSFLSMGVHGTASLEVVGPGVAEALITTIAGLAAAIPALVGYNILGRHVRRQETRIDLFITRIVDTIDVAATARKAPASEAAYEKNSV
ncbi:MAG: MotA/TolQ/ExbB proton channel family protein [Chitinivibrionia bacterium]|nr:MotA/TolQ/ExbB proton channel family protein [Chitinivibrionia bacterium]